MKNVFWAVAELTCPAPHFTFLQVISFVIWGVYGHNLTCIFAVLIIFFNTLKDGACAFKVHTPPPTTHLILAVRSTRKCDMGVILSVAMLLSFKSAQFCSSQFKMLLPFVYVAFAL